MKKLFLLLLLIVLAGAGCAQGGLKIKDKDVVSGDWWLAFDLPEDWAMYAHYEEDEPAPQDTVISRELGDIIIQSTSSPVILEGDTPADAVTDFVEDNYSYARVFRYDPRTSVPDDAEDLGEGFYKRVRDDGSIEYYLVGVNGKYKILVEQEGQELAVIEEVIRSAEEVTDLE